MQLQHDDGWTGINYVSPATMHRLAKVSLTSSTVDEDIDVLWRYCGKVPGGSTLFLEIP